MQRNHPAVYDKNPSADSHVPYNHIKYPPAADAPYRSLQIPVYRRKIHLPHNVVEALVDDNTPLAFSYRQSQTAHRNNLSTSGWIHIKSSHSSHPALRQSLPLLSVQNPPPAPRYSDAPDKPADIRFASRSPEASYR